MSKYCADIPQAVQGQYPARTDGPIVLLTGSTGSIGSNILASLLSERKVVQIYALSRQSTTEDRRLRTAFEDRSLPVSLLDDSRLSILVGDVTQPNWALDKAQYDEVQYSLPLYYSALRGAIQVLSSVTHIVHNAWTINFNLPLSSYEAQISGVRSLVNVCANAPQSIQIIFTSSIGVATGWDVSKGPVPERILDDPEVAVASGYTASKYVSEQVHNATWL